MCICVCTRAHVHVCVFTCICVHVPRASCVFNISKNTHYRSYKLIVIIMIVLVIQTCYDASPVSKTYTLFTI